MFDISLGYKRDTDLRYAVLAFKCEKGGEPLWDYVSIAMRNSVVVRVYVNWTNKISYNLAPKSP